MAETGQFDEFLGGSQKLPNEVHIMKLVSARAGEIAAMTYSIENPQQTKLVFQKLPVYMRRRVMSHNVKRLPRRLQEAHLNQMTKSGLPPKIKRPSRRYRRRPRNLLAEYKRRQRNKIWLETHIWHAKRFHMIEKWGYKIASYANDKCFKANYRAIAKHCLMQDISYYTCVEINGLEEILKETLKSHCNPLELTFAAKIFITGTREGTVMFYKKNGYPQFPIGYVYFLWRPSHSDLRTIWIWVHPSFLNDFITEIILSFGFKSSDEHFISNSNQTPECSLYINETNCKMIIHKNIFNRFRFYGPSTINVLTNALHLPNFDKIFHLKSDKMQFDDNQMNCESQNYNNKSWYIEYYNQENIESLKIQKQLWQVLKTLQSPSQLPPNIVLGFTVLDPRFYLPVKRTKPQRDNLIETIEIMSMPIAKANFSPIWEQKIREKVSKTYITTSAINKLRSQCLVPGLNNDKYFNEEVMAKIPILLIQKPGIGNTGLNSSIDIILPSNWAMPFWLACIFRCVRVGALRESKSIAFEYENMKCSNINDPDTPAYAREALNTKLELKEKYFHYPPNRRVNFIKFGISSPFFCEWKILMKEWAATEDFFVLRNRKLLNFLQDSLSSVENVESTLIWYRGTDSENFKYWIDSLESFLKDYITPGSIPGLGANINKCDYNQPPPPGKVCDVDVKNWYPCTKENKYNYHKSAPCIFLKLNKIYGWKPEFYNDTNSLPQNMPIDLKEHITGLKNTYQLDTIWVSCEGENPADQENIGPIEYIPRRGFPGYFYPFENSEGYLSPLVAIHFVRPRTGILINVECKAWARNIKHSRHDKMGVVHFELMID